MATADRYIIRIAATFTADVLAEPLAYWMRELAIRADITFLPYGQVFQSLLDPGASQVRRGRGIDVVLIKLDDWVLNRGAKAGGQTPGDDLQGIVQDLLLALTTAAEQSVVPYVIVFCPPSPAPESSGIKEHRFAEMEQWVASALHEHPGICVVTSSDITSLYPVERCHDPLTDREAHVPYTREFFTRIATVIARKIFALSVSPYKAIVLDCDDTLWTGICGEDGVDGVRIDAPRRVLQEALVAQYEAGMLLCICSKNNEEDVSGVFDRHPGMILKRHHIVSWRVNWRSKSENIKALANELNIGLESFILIDDSPVECAEVRTHHPEIGVLQLPEDYEEIPLFLRHIWAFDHVQVTEEDRARTQRYRDDVKRKRSLRPKMTFQDFLNGLELEVCVLPLLPSQAGRVSQLTFRTNQFNCTTQRRSEAEIRTILESQQLECLIVQVTDRFGDYGLVGFVAIRSTPQVLEVETLLLSCRVLGRGVEHEIVAQLAERAKQRGVKWVEILWSQTDRNQPSRDFLESLGGQALRRTDGSFVFRLSAEDALSTAYRPESMASDGVGGVSPSPEASDRSDSHVTRAQCLGRIASALGTLDSIRTADVAMDSAGQDHQIKHALARPLTPTERILADIWQTVLGIERIEADHNFLNLGGHSLLAVQVMSRVHDAFGVELSIQDFFEAQRLSELAARIELRQIEAAEPRRVMEVLEELESLTDEQVEAMLSDIEGQAS